MAGEIQVYGAEWCGLTYRVREYMMNARVKYEYFDIERDADAQELVLSMNDGECRLPVVIVEERVVIGPTTAELQQVLDEQGIRPEPRARRT